MKTITLARPEAGSYDSVRFEPGAAIHLAFNPALAAFERAGNDLVVTFSDGGELSLRGLFLTGALPGSLYMANGTELAMDSFLDIFAPDMDVAAGGEEAKQIFRGSSMADYADATDVAQVHSFSITDDTALLSLALSPDDEEEGGLFFPSFGNRGLFDTLLPLASAFETEPGTPGHELPGMTPDPSYGFAMIGHTAMAKEGDAGGSQNTLPVVAGKVESDPVFLDNAVKRPDGCWTADSADGRGTVVYNPDTGYIACFIKPEFIDEWTSSVRESGWFEINFTYYTGIPLVSHNGTALFVNDAAGEALQQQIAERTALLGEDQIVSSILPDWDASEGRVAPWPGGEDAVSSIGHILEQGFPGMSISGGNLAVFEDGRLSLGSEGAHGALDISAGNAFLNGLVLAHADVNTGNEGNNISVAGLESCTVFTYDGDDYIRVGHATDSSLHLGFGHDTLAIQGSLVNTLVDMGSGNDLVHITLDGSARFSNSVIDGGENEAADYVSGRVGDILSFNFTNLLQAGGFGGTPGQASSDEWSGWEGLSFANFEALRIDLSDSGDDLSIQLHEVLSVIKRLPLDEGNDVRALIITGDNSLNSLPDSGGWDAQGSGTTVEGMGDLVFQHYYNAEENMHLYIQQQVNLIA